MVLYPAWISRYHLDTQANGIGVTFYNNVILWTLEDIPEELGTSFEISIMIKETIMIYMAMINSIYETRSLARVENTTFYPLPVLYWYSYHTSWRILVTSVNVEYV